MSTEEPRALAYQPGEAKTVSFGANIVTFLARREDTTGIYSLTEFTVAPPPTPGPPLHIYKVAHEAMYVLEGGSGSNRTELEYPGANRIARENLLFAITCRRCGTLISARILLPARMRP